MLFVLCTWGGAGDRVPTPPDYCDSTQWYIQRRGAAADLFYIISTEIGDYVADGDTVHHADTYDMQVRKKMLKEMRAVDSLFGGDCNYFSPYYRQVTMQSWATEEMAMSRLPVGLGDIARSWEYYLKHLNQGRPFILAGFSQGAHAMTELMRHMPDSVANRMVAAYSIGYKITQAMLDSIPHIKPATGATDVGVTINYNSVRSADCAIPIVSDGNVVNINPVNWRTDTVRAHFGDSLTVWADPVNHLCIVEGYTEKYILPIIGRRGNYHQMELKFYYPHIRRNIADRVQAFLRQREEQ